MKKILLPLLMVLAAIMPSSMNGANQYGIPEKIQDGNILHCFDWTFADIKKELPNIAAAGFGAVQVSPVQGNCATNAEWFYAYMPYDFKFRTNGNGSSAALKDLCTEASKYGIKIVVDVVANHINQAANYHDTWWDSNGRIRWNGGVDYGNRYSITHNQLGEYGDVNSEDSQVQARAKAFLEDLKALGVAGIRWDAAKHIGLPSEGCNFWSQMASVAGLWHYGEILDGPGGDKYKLLKEYTNYIGVTDSEYSKWCLNEVNSGRVPSGGQSWGANGVPTTAIVLWAESHDDYSNDGQYGQNTALISQDKMDRAYAISACRKNETALYFSRPSATTRNTIKMGQKGSTHFTSKEVAEVNKFRNAMVGTDDYYSSSNGVACITRKGGGAVIVVGAGGSRSVSVPNGGAYVPAGKYVDKVSGNTFTVTSSTITGQTGSTGIAVIYGEVTREPMVTLSPAGGEFNNTLTITITPENFVSAWYKLGNGTQTTLTGTKTITIGADMSVGQSVVLSWSATDDKGVTKTGSATYKKVEKVVPANPYVTTSGVEIQDRDITDTDYEFISLLKSEDFPFLYCINFTHCGNIDYKKLLKHDDIDYIIFKGCSGINFSVPEELNAEDMLQLSTIKFIGCKNIDYEGLSELDSVGRLEFTGCENIDLEAVAKMKSISYIDMTGCTYNDITVLYDSNINSVWVNSKMVWHKDTGYK